MKARKDFTKADKIVLPAGIAFIVISLGWYISYLVIIWPNITWPY